MTTLPEASGDVRSAVRVLRIFEAFASQGSPMNLSELASRLEMPPSSCLLLIRTLLNRGYLYGTGRRNTYYPTQRLVDVAHKVAAGDPLLQRLQPSLDRIRDATRETVAFSKLQGSRLIYLAVAESTEPLRVTATLGDLRPLHSTASGKALLMALPVPDRRALLAELTLQRLTDRTIASAEDLEAAIERARAVGYAVNSGEAVSHLSAVATPIEINSVPYAMSVMGPSHRVDRRFTELGEMLVDFCRSLRAELTGGDTQLASVA